MTSELEKWMDAHPLGCAVTQRMLLHKGYALAIQIAEAECQKVEGRTTKYYRGDTMTANELLEVLKRYAGVK
jgi:hypothetical protein